jgi:diguanylate cyclase (GGDEF)-like protein
VIGASRRLDKQLALARRRKVSLATLVLDLDHFKRLNDTHGHLVGDRALAAFAACLHGQVRNGDAVVRYGGEEFVVVLVDTPLAAAAQVAERIRAAVEAIVVASPGQIHGQILRASVGVAAYPDHGDDPAGLLAAADRAVYAAKREGRNRVVVAPPIGEDRAAS